MNRNLSLLVGQCRDVDQFFQKIVAFPHWYLKTNEEKRLTKKDLREFYSTTKGE